MATSVLISALPVGVPTRACQRPYKQLGRFLGSRATSFRSNWTPLCSSGENRCTIGSRATSFRSNGTPLCSSGENRCTIGRELGIGSKGVPVFVQGRRGGPVKSQGNDKGGQEMDEKKPFYAALEFWIQVAVVILTFGFVDAGYSGDWSRIGALSRETEAALRTAAYVVVPVSAVLVWVIGKRRKVS